MKMNAPLCVSLVVSFLLLSTAAIRADPLSIAAEFEDPEGRRDFGALRDLMDSVMDLYTPALKARILSLEKRLENMTTFSGSIYLEGQEDRPVPKISGEAAIGNETEEEEQPLVNWNINTSLDFDSGGVGMELWKETGFARISFSNEVEQDFSDDFEYKSLIKLEKKF